MSWGIYAAGVVTGIFAVLVGELVYDELDYRRTMKKLDEEKEN